MVRRLGAGLLAVVLLLAVPAAWGCLEYRAATERSRLAAAIGADWASERLGAVLARFETVTARLRPGATPAENAALTARLFRIEPQLHPATTLFIIGPQLRIAAASHPVDGEAMGHDASEWLRAMMDQPGEGVALRDFPGQSVLGMATHLAMARRIDDANGGAAGLALTFLDRAALRDLIHPAWLRAEGTVRLVERATGHVIAADAPARPAGAPSGGAIFAIRKAAVAIMGEHRVQAGARINQGLAWSVTMDPWDALALDAPGLRQRGLLALGLAVLLAALAIIIAAASGGGTARGEYRRAIRQGLEASSAPTTPPSDAAGATGATGNVEDLLDAAYIDPGGFDALVREFGPVRSAQMVREFLAADALWMPRLVSLAAARDWPAFARACRELSEVTATFGAVRFAETLGHLGRAKGDPGTTIDLGIVAKEWRLTKRALANLIAPGGSGQAPRGKAA